MILVRLAAAPLLLTSGARAEGYPVANAAAFQACVSDHAPKPGRYISGAILLGLHGAPAGKVACFAATRRR